MQIAAEAGGSEQTLPRDTMSAKLRRRRRSGIPPLKRLSTTSPVEPEQTQEHKWHPFTFDSLTYASTEWRNVQMCNDNEEAQIIHHFGSEVHFSSLYHYSREELEPYRLVGDVEMDTLLDYLADHGGCGAFDDVIGLCQGDYEKYLDLSEESLSTTRSLAVDFYAHYYNIPSWVDWEQIQRGIDIFLAYLPATGSALYYRSLIGGFSIPKIVSILC